jgi:N-methylhydantoinase B
MDGVGHPLSGMCGGDDASSYSSRFEVGTPNEYKVELSARAQLPAGAVIAYQHGGGAGFGSPLQRDPAAVKEDVLDEYVSFNAARDKYGVVLTGSLEKYDLEVDIAATASLRTTMQHASRVGE